MTRIIALGLLGIALAAPGVEAQTVTVPAPRTVARPVSSIRASAVAVPPLIPKRVTKHFTSVPRGRFGSSSGAGRKSAIMST